MSDIKPFEDDIFISVRNILVPKVQIQQMLDMMPGTSLVQDSEVDVIYELDRELKKFRHHNPDKEVASITLPTYPLEIFFPVYIKVENPIFQGTTVDARKDRPAWFRFKRSFVFHDRPTKGKSRMH